MKKERLWIRLGAGIAILATVVIGLLGVFALRNQFHQNIQDAQVVSARRTIATSVDEFRKILETESKRPFTEYSHSNFSGVSAKSFLRFSNISAIEPSVRIPGLIGFFQVTEKKKLELPFFPESLNTDKKDREQRRDLARKIYGALFKTGPMSADTETQNRFRKVFSGIWLPNFDASEIEMPKSVPTKALSLKLLSKTGKSVKGIQDVEEIEDLRPQSQTLSSNSEALPMQAFILESGTIVFYRNVLHSGRLLTQGFIVEQKAFFQSLFKELLMGVAQTSKNPLHLTLLIDNKALGIFPTPSADENPILQFYEFSPLDNFSLLFTAGDIKLPPIQIAALFLVGFTVLLILSAIALMYASSFRQLELLERQAAFVSSVSHELRTPITAIRMHAELLKSGWSMDEPSKEKSHDYILKESERLSRLIENVLRYARIGRDNDPLRLETLTTADVQNLLQEKIFPLVKQGGYKLEVNVGAMAQVIETDRDALTQILINIVDNAMKFSRGSADRKLVIGLRANDESIEIKVRDFGPGISEHHKNKVFDLFFRAEDELTRSTPGTGLGLALVKSLADRLGHKVKFVNVRPGCEFTVQIPVKIEV